MKLEIITPERIFFSGDVDSVTLPGNSGLFTVLENHAPMISLLSSGSIKYSINSREINLEIESGFVEISTNLVSICIEAVVK